MSSYKHEFLQLARSHKIPNEESLWSSMAAFNKAPHIYFNEEQFTLTTEKACYDISLLNFKQVRYGMAQYLFNLYQSNIMLEALKAVK